MKHGLREWIRTKYGEGKPQTVTTSALAECVDIGARAMGWYDKRGVERTVPGKPHLRKGIGMLESCFDPELVCEITMQPIRRHGVDALRAIGVVLRSAHIDEELFQSRKSLHRR